LLVPNDFGLLGVAKLADSTLKTFSQTGFHAGTNLNTAILNQYKNLKGLSNEVN